MPTEKTIMSVFGTFVKDLGQVLGEVVPKRDAHEDALMKLALKIAELEEALVWYADEPVTAAVERWKKRNDPQPGHGETITTPSDGKIYSETSKRDDENGT